MALTEVDAARLNDNVFNTVGPFKNRIINGDMRIDQRNAGASVTVNSTTDFYPVDRFNGVGQSSDGVFTLQQSTTAPTGFVNSIIATVTTADASIGASQFYFLRHIIEGTNTSDLAWGTASASAVTLSFWVRSSVTGTLGGVVKNNAQDYSYPFTYSVASSNTWEYKTITISGPTAGTWLTTTGSGIQVAWSLGSGSSTQGASGSWAAANYRGATGETPLISTNGATFYITGVQLEAGTVATPFERRSYGQELALCQRYYETSYPIGTAPGSVLTTSPTTNAGNATFREWQDFKVTKRASPNMVFYSPDTGASGKLRDAIGSADITAIADNATATGSRVSADSVTAGNVIRWHYTASSEL